MRSEPNEISVVLIQFSPTRYGPDMSRREFPNAPVSWKFPELQEVVDGWIIIGGLSMYYSLFA